MMRVVNPVIRRFAEQGRLSMIAYSLKGRITSPEDEEGSGASSQQRLVVTPEADIETELARFEEYRVIYHELEMSNGSHLLLNRQLSWDAPSGESYRIGPDLHSQVEPIEMYWAAELKGGADPAGSDEHWKTATQALQRIKDAASKTERQPPLLSFIATILVDRVAREAQDWLNNGILTSVYNLTKMYQQDDEMERFLADMARFLGYTASLP
jgi:hypothetical protein